MGVFKPQVKNFLLHSCYKLCHIGYVVLLWALPAPQTILAVGSYQELPHQVSNLQSKKVATSTFTTGVTADVHRLKLLFLLKDFTEILPIDIHY
jgi:uncharacterized membrane protein